MKKRVLICMLAVMMIGLYLPAFVFAEAAVAASEKTEVTEDITAEPSTASAEQSEEDNEVASTSVDDEEESLDEADDQLVAEEESLDEENQQADEEEDLDEADDQLSDDDEDESDDEDDDWDVDEWWNQVEWLKDEGGNEYYIYEEDNGKIYTIMKNANGDIYFIKDGNRYDLNKKKGTFVYTDEEGNVTEIFLNIAQSLWEVISLDDQPTPSCAGPPDSGRSASKAKTAATADQEETPDTGDATPLVAYVMIFAAATALLAGILIKRYREN